MRYYHFSMIQTDTNDDEMEKALENWNEEISLSRASFPFEKHTLIKSRKSFKNHKKNIHLNIAKKKNLLNRVSNESSTQTKWWWWKHPRFSFRNSESENSFFLSLWKSLCCIGLIVPFIVIESLLINCKPKGQLHRLVNHLIIWKSLFQLNNLTFQFQFGILISPWLGCNLCNFVFSIDLDDYDNCENRKWFHFLQMIANWIGRHWKWLGSTHCETIISIF